MISRKIGLHIIGSPDVALGQPTCVKWIDPSPGQLAEARWATPDALFVVRFFQANEPHDSPERRAEEWVTKYQSRMMDLRGAAGPNVVFSLYNEVGDGGASEYNRMSVRWIGLMHNLGLRCAVGSFGVGNPDWPVWETYRPMLAAMGPDDVVDLHEYWPDHAEMEHPWYVRRFQHPEAEPYLRGKRIIIGECGRDVFPDKPVVGAAGWKKSCTADEFIADLRRLGELYDSCPQVIGATVFQAGSPDPTWKDYDVEGIWPRVVAEYATPVPTPPSAPVVPYYYSQRNAAIQYVILHDTEGDADVAERWFRDPANLSRSSTHKIVRMDGRVMDIVPDDLAAHHAGLGTIAALPGVNPNRVSLGLELEYPAAPASPPWPEAQLAAAARVVKAWCERYNIPESHILTHRQVDPNRRTDPRNFDRTAFVNRIWPPTEPLPNDEQGDARALADKARWWAEEMHRQYEAGNIGRAKAIRLSLIDLLYRLETMLGG